MLRVDGVGVRYGAVQAVDGVSFAVEPGQIVALLGSNGAGKTSTLRAISGLVPHTGAVAVDGTVAHLPEGRGLFRRLTVEQNLSLAGYRKGGGRDAIARAFDAVPDITRFRGRRVGTLSGGEQALVALARLLAAEPDYALLDEPTVGLAPAAIERLVSAVADLRDGGCGVVLVEQYAARALELADSVVVLERGRVTYAGEPAGVGDPDDLVRSYLKARA